MLHKPVVLKLEEPRVTGKLSQPAPAPLDAVGHAGACRRMRRPHVRTGQFGPMPTMAGSIMFATRPTSTSSSTHSCRTSLFGCAI